MRARIDRVLLDGADAEPRTALLVSLLVALDLVKRLVPKNRRKEAGRRAEVVAERGIVGSAVERSVRELQTAIMVGVVAGAAASAGADGGGGNGGGG